MKVMLGGDVGGWGQVKPGECVDMGVDMWKCLVPCSPTCKRYSLVQPAQTVSVRVLSSLYSVSLGSIVALLLQKHTL